MSPPDDLDRLSHAELKGLVVEQWEQMVELQRLVAALREEIGRRFTAMTKPFRHAPKYN